jgi:omega-hydroxy-beta-dihydromenaquinone-9 sulfotransferase
MKLNYPIKDTLLLFQHTAMGIDLKTWLRVLWENKFCVHPAYWPKAFFITLMALVNLPLHLFEKWVFANRIRQVNIEKPVFIMGYPRSGTTYLFYVLGADPNLAYASTYQVLTPHIFLTFGTWMRKLFQKAMPATRPQDNVRISADSPSEEEFAIANMSPVSIANGYIFPQRIGQVFERSVLFRGRARLAQEWKRTFHYFSQKVMLVNPGKTMLSKSPLNTGRISQILELYPDARFVHIHRNPYEVYVSNEGLLEKILPKMGLNRAKEEDLQQFILDSYRDSYKTFLQVAETLPANQLAEIGYAEFVRNPIELLEKVYAQLELGDFSPVRAFLEQEVKATKGYQKNTYDKLSVQTSEQIQQQWGFMFDRYGYDNTQN